MLTLKLPSNLSLQPLFAAGVLLALGGAGQDAELRWTAAQAASHADDYNNPDLWQSERLEDDLELIGVPLDEALTVLPFPYIAFPTPDYDRTGVECPGLSVGPLSLPAPLVGSQAAVNLDFDSKTLAEGENWWEVIEAQPLMAVVAVGETPLENKQQWAISRSHPHYFFQGTFANARGEVDWAAIRMGGGALIGIVNGRILDLTQGNLIFVRQLDDGSIRIHQDRTRLEAGNSASVAAQVDRHLSMPTARDFFDLGD